MGLRTIGILLLLVLGLGALLYFTDEKQKAAATAEMPVLDGRSLAECSRLRWQFARAVPIEVTRDSSGRFQISEPLVDVASTAYMKVVVDAWSGANMRATPIEDNEAGRASAGLAAPELTLLAEFPDKVRMEFEVGAPGPLGATRFLRCRGKIWECGDALIESLRVGLEDLRDHTVYRHQPPQVNELRVDQASPTGKRETLHLKFADNEWRLLSPIMGRADRAAAQHFVVAVLSQRIDYFVPGLMKPRTDEPNIVVTVHGTHGEEVIRLWIVGGGQLLGNLPQRNVWFTSDNQQYVAIFENGSEPLRARVLVSLGDGAENVYEHLAEVVVDPGQGRGDRLRLRRESATSEWRLVEPVEWAANPSSCNDGVQAVNNLFAQEFVSEAGEVRPRAEDARYGLTAGRLQVSLRGFLAREATTLWLGGATKRGELTFHFACRADEPDNVVLVPQMPVETLSRPWTDYCAKRILTVSGIGRLDVQNKAGERRRFLLVGERWTCEGKEGERPEVGDLATDRLRDLSGKRVVDARGGVLGEADWTLVVMRQNGDELAGLRVWQRTQDAPLLVQPVLGDVPVAFELSTLDSQALRTLWQ